MSRSPTVAALLYTMAPATPRPATGPPDQELPLAVTAPAPPSSTAATTRAPAAPSLPATIAMAIPESATQLPPTTEAVAMPPPPPPTPADASPRRSRSVLRRAARAFAKAVNAVGRAATGRPSDKSKAKSSSSQSADGLSAATSAAASEVTTPVNELDLPLERVVASVLDPLECQDSVPAMDDDAVNCMSAEEQVPAVAALPDPAPAPEPDPPAPPAPATIESIATVDLVWHIILIRYLGPRDWARVRSATRALRDASDALPMLRLFPTSSLRARVLASWASADAADLVARMITGARIPADTRHHHQPSPLVLAGRSKAWRTVDTLLRLRACPSRALPQLNGATTAPAASGSGTVQVGANRVTGGARGPVPLLMAARSGDVELLSRYLGSGRSRADLRVPMRKSKFMRTPMHCAVESGNVAAVQVLLDHGAELLMLPDAKRSRRALRERRAAAVASATSASVASAPDQPASDAEPAPADVPVAPTDSDLAAQRHREAEAAHLLGLAAKTRSMKMLTWLLTVARVPANGWPTADAFQHGLDDKTALHWAVSGRQKAIVALLLQHGVRLHSPEAAVDPTFSDWEDMRRARTALDMAIDLGDLDLITMLVQASVGMDPDAAPESARTAVLPHCCSRLNDKDVATRCVLSHVQCIVEHTPLDMIKAMVTRFGAQFSTPERPWTLPTDPLKCNLISLARGLGDLPASGPGVDGGYVALCIAARAHKWDVVRYLLDEHQVPPNCAAHTAAAKDRTDQTPLPAEFTDAPLYGKTPLHLAIDANEPELVCDLLDKYGALVNVKDATGHTPLDVETKRAGATPLAIDLLRRGARGSEEALTLILHKSLLDWEVDQVRDLLTKQYVEATNRIESLDATFPVRLHEQTRKPIDQDYQLYPDNIASLNVVVEVPEVPEVPLPSLPSQSAQCLAKESSSEQTAASSSDAPAPATDAATLAGDAPPASPTDAAQGEPAVVAADQDEQVAAPSEPAAAPAGQDEPADGAAATQAQPTVAPVAQDEPAELSAAQVDPTDAVPAPGEPTDATTTQGEQDAAAAAPNEPAPAATTQTEPAPTATTATDPSTTATTPKPATDESTFHYEPDVDLSHPYFGGLVSPLFRAVAAGNHAVAELLLTSGAHPDHGLRPGLARYSCQFLEGSSSGLRAITDSAKPPIVRSPLAQAILRGDAAMVELLLEKRANASRGEHLLNKCRAKNSSCSTTPLQLALGLRFLLLERQKKAAASSSPALAAAETVTDAPATTTPTKTPAAGSISPLMLTATLAPLSPPSPPPRLILTSTNFAAPSTPIRFGTPLTTDTTSESTPESADASTSSLAPPAPTFQFAFAASPTFGPARSPLLAAVSTTPTAEIALYTPLDDVRAKLDRRIDQFPSLLTLDRVDAVLRALRAHNAPLMPNNGNKTAKVAKTAKHHHARPAGARARVRSLTSGARPATVAAAQGTTAATDAPVPAAAASVPLTFTFSAPAPAPAPGDASTEAASAPSSLPLATFGSGFSFGGAGAFSFSFGASSSATPAATAAAEAAS
ncbi:hypothetical protein AMAG_18887 [Allomyces macrogynus ATCC 38327]|uniref:Uncharacterized protein n=1 Tax=Allomyces macrogynus (strain ATCC 38327) TaxID=578462 RepID=A0A0L0SJK9_ALLM3|nr:hypothetical protein AMAG_18887 [Allomyces macrogynus ATCC 38327]|eukprot:KNE62565.1 hypothetical protein AMAG_18887 [Allomyces macrogynus ATCC 38327]